MKQNKLSEKQINDLLRKIGAGCYRAQRVEEFSKLSGDKLIEYINKVNLSAEEVISLMKSGPSAAVRAYIEKRKFLSVEAQTELLKHGTEEDFIRFIEVATNEQWSMADTQIIQTRNERIIKAYLSKYSLNKEAQIELVKLDNIDLLACFLEKNFGGMFDDAFKLMSVETYDQLFEYVKVRLPNETEATFIRTASAGLVKRYLLRFDLMDLAQIALVARGDHDLIMYFLRFYVFDSDLAITELAKRMNLEEIKACCERAALTAEAQVFIIEHGTPKLINWLISQNLLLKSAELALVKKGDHDAIMKYLERHRVYPETGGKIIDRGNSDEIKACIKRGIFFGEYSERIILRGYRDEVELLLATSYPNIKIGD